jgi:hypothetical protein
MSAQQLRVFPRTSLRGGERFSLRAREFANSSDANLSNAEIENLRQLNVKCPNYDDPLSIFYIHNYVASNFVQYKGKNKRFLEIPIEVIFTQINKSAIDICNIDKFIEQSHFCPFYRVQMKSNECSKSWINGFCTNHWKSICRFDVLIEEGGYSPPNGNNDGTQASIIKFCYSEHIHKSTLLFPFFSRLPDSDSINQALSESMAHLNAENLAAKDDLIRAFKCFLFSDDTYDKTARESWIRDMAKIYQDMPIDATISIFDEKDSRQAKESINIKDMSLLDIPFLAGIGTMHVGKNEHTFFKIANQSICILDRPIVGGKNISYWYQSGGVLKIPLPKKVVSHRDSICAKNPYMRDLYQFAYVTHAYESPTINGRMSFMYPNLGLLNSKPQQLIIEIGKNCNKNK